MNLRRVSGDESSADFYFVIFCKSRTRSFARVRAAFLICRARYTETVAADDREDPVPRSFSFRSSVLRTRNQLLLRRTDRHALLIPLRSR